MHLYHTVPTEVRRGCQIPWNWSYGCLLATMWVLGIEPGPLQEQLVLSATPALPSCFFKYDFIYFLRISFIHTVILVFWDKFSRVWRSLIRLGWLVSSSALHMTLLPQRWDTHIYLKCLCWRMIVGKYSVFVFHNHAIMFCKSRNPCHFQHGTVLNLG